MEMSRKADNNVLSTKCDIIIFPIYGQFGATWKRTSQILDAWSVKPIIFHEQWLFILQKLKTDLTSLNDLSKGINFDKKYLFFEKKNHNPAN